MFVAGIGITTGAWLTFVAYVKFPLFFHSRRLVYVVCGGIIALSVLHQVGVTSYRLNPWIDYTLIIGSLLTIGFFRSFLKGSYRGDSLEGVIIIKKGDNPFVLAIKKWKKKLKVNKVES